MSSSPRTRPTRSIARGWLACLTTTLLLSPGSIALCQDVSAGAGSTGERSLQPVRRADGRQNGGPGGPTLDRFFSKKFSSSEWVALLESEDLDRREESYRLLLRRARVDPLVRGFLEKLALDTERVHLAWTARLGLRELSLHSSYRQRNAMQLFGFDSQVQKMLGEMLGEYPGLPLGPPSVAQAPQDGATVLVRTDVLGVFVPRANELDPGDEQPGLLVTRIEPGTIAHRMGMGAGDILLRINNRDMHLPADITDILRGRARHEPVTVEWLDDLKTLQSTTWTPDSGN